MKDTHQPATTKIYTQHTAGRGENISNVRLHKNVIDTKQPAAIVRDSQYIAGRGKNILKCLNYYVILVV